MFRRDADVWLDRISRLAAGLAAAIVGLIGLFVLGESMPALHRIGLVRFFSDASWHPLSGEFNLLPMIAGTLLTSLGALALAAPLGLGSAVFGCFYAGPRLAAWHRRFIELLAGVPSVVFGLWGLVVVVPMLAKLGGSGQSLLAAILILALMILPTVALTAGAALEAVPADLIAGGAALGLERSDIAIRIALPAAQHGVRAGLVLAAARALGETMAVLMVAGNVAQWPDSVVSPVRTLTTHIALEMGYATSEHRSVLFVSGLLLLVGAGVLALGVHREPGRRESARG